MKPFAPSFRATGALLLAGLFAGCAVLTIDVDAYKGVLSNEQSTQINHLRALAPASRNLLVQMFNDLPIHRKTDTRLRLRIDEKIGAIFEQQGCSDNTWTSVSAVDFLNRYPSDLKGDDLAQKRIAIRLAYLVGLFDTVRPEHLGPKSQAAASLNTGRITNSGKPNDEILRLVAETLVAEGPEARKKSEDKLRAALPKAGQITDPETPADGILSLAAKALPKKSTDPKTQEYNEDAFRDAMSGLGNQMVLLSQFGDFGMIGLGPRVWKGFKNLGRNGGSPSTSDALMLAQALGNSILTITDELYHRDEWDRNTRRKALAELEAVRKALYLDESTVGQIWLAHAKLAQESAEKASAAAVANVKEAKARQNTLAPQDQFSDLVENTENIRPKDSASDTPLDFAKLWEKFPEKDRPKASDKKIRDLLTLSGISPDSSLTVADWKGTFEKVIKGYDQLDKGLADQAAKAEAGKDEAKKRAENAKSFAGALAEFLKTQKTSTVSELIEALKTDTKFQNHPEWVAALIKETPILDLPPLQASESNDLTQRQVSDALVATLRAYRLRLLLSPQSADDKTSADARKASLAHLDEALKQIEESQADAIPLRPAGAILRTASPVTAFQSNAARTSGNMLTQFVLDSIPVAGPALKSIGSGFSNPDANPELAMRLDREFWQPINHIELQGLGKTNYAVIKDDIGNWYVKSYSADPEEAMKSFSNILGRYYVPIKGLSAIAASAGQTTAQTADSGAAAEELKTAVQENERQMAEDFAKSVGKLETGVRALSKDADGHEDTSRADVLKNQIAEINKTNEGRPLERSRALLSLGKDYGLQRVAAAAQAQNSAPNDAKAQELTAAMRQLAEFKTAAKTFFKERSEQLTKQETFLRESLLATIKP